MSEPTYQVWDGCCPFCQGRTYQAHGLDLRQELHEPALAGRRCLNCKGLSYEKISRRKTHPK